MVPTLIEGDAGNDHLIGGAGPDTLLGGDGKDMLKGRGGDDLLDGGAGKDNLDGGSGNDILLGGGGNDLLNSGKGQDLLIGGLGADDLKAGSDGGSRGGSDCGERVAGDILIGGSAGYDVDTTILRDILDNDWIARFHSGDDYEDIVNDLVTNRFIAGVTAFDDGVKDKLKGSNARDLFFAGIHDKIMGKTRDELVIDLAEVLTLNDSIALG